MIRTNKLIHLKNHVLFIVFAAVFLCCSVAYSQAGGQGRYVAPPEECSNWHDCITGPPGSTAFRAQGTIVESCSKWKYSYVTFFLGADNKWYFQECFVNNNGYLIPKKVEENRRKIDGAPGELVRLSCSSLSEDREMDSLTAKEVRTLRDQIGGSPPTIDCDVSGDGVIVKGRMSNDPNNQGCLLGNFGPKCANDKLYKPVCPFSSSWDGGLTEIPQPQTDEERRVWAKLGDPRFYTSTASCQCDGDKCAGPRCMELTINGESQICLATAEEAQILNGGAFGQNNVLVSLIAGQKCRRKIVCNTINTNGSTDNTNGYEKTSCGSPTEFRIDRGQCFRSNPDYDPNNRVGSGHPYLSEKCVDERGCPNIACPQGPNGYLNCPDLMPPR